jgi:hypothetical protein
VRVIVYLFSASWSVATHPLNGFSAREWDSIIPKPAISLPLKHIKEKQIGPESSSLHFALQIAVSRGDEANVHLLGAGVSQPRKLARLQNSKQMRLELERKVADLVKK